ncbi:MAG: hypothetical protein LWX01_06825 [Deltaproteobacteria bacterium]|nr:hypothetical protein [Deltaproteobacteria bacterium]MDL1961401.1 hypothetical protein [Deltaproteobacteria bacterium]
MIVVTDSTVLIGLAKIGKLDLLRKIFSKVYIPQEVFKEVVEKGRKSAIIAENTTPLPARMFEEKGSILDIIFSNLPKMKTSMLFL